MADSTGRCMVDGVFVEIPSEHGSCSRLTEPMPRRALIYVPNLSVHVFPRGINGGAIVRDDDDHEHLLRVIVKAARQHGVEINALALMTTHYHLIVTPTWDGALAKAMQAIGIRHTRFLNRKYGRIGTIWNERYGAALLDDERYWYTCLRYVELNPFRAHVVASPEAARWSSYRFHALGEPCEWVTPHPLYMRLGATAKARQEAYRAMCGVSLTDEELDRQRHPPRRATLQLPTGA
jgi:putative transposase